VTWNSDKWYGFPSKPFEVGFIPRNDSVAAADMIDAEVAAVIVEPVQGVAGAFDIAPEFLATLRNETARHGALLIADEVQSGMGRSGRFFACKVHDIEPDLLTAAKSLAGGIPAGAVLATDTVAAHFGAGTLGTTFGGGPLAAAATVAVIDAIYAENLLANVRAREMEIRERCLVGPVVRIQGMGLLLGLVCDRPAAEIRDALLDHDILTGTSSDPKVLRILAPLVLESHHVERLQHALATIPPAHQ
jgi:acetylornithine/succinyldiaminopimelate/putrescine aminotransferase